MLQAPVFRLTARFEFNDLVVWGDDDKVLLEATQCQGCHCLLSRVQHFSCNAHTTPCDNFPFLLSSRADYDPVGMFEARGRVLPPS
jgi:hypothetical protein